MISTILSVMVSTIIVIAFLALVRRFKNQIDLYQVLIADFIPDKLSGVALDYRPRDTEILEVDEEYEQSSY